MVRMLGGWMVVWGLLAIHPVQASTERKDLVTPLGNLFCKGDFGPLQLWEMGVYDGQIEGQQVETPSFIALKEEDVWNQAKSFAAVRLAGGYAAGLCNQHKGWTAAMPATGPLGLGDRPKPSLPRDDLQKMCRSWKVHFSSSEGGISRDATPGESGSKILKIDGLPQGVVSLHCRPQFPRWTGEQVWYFYPTHDPKFYMDFPGKSGLKSGDLTMMDVSHELLPWLNGIRAREKLGPLLLNPHLTEAASRLLVSDTIDHDVTQMEEVRQKFASATLKLEGENRVRGKTLEELAWLLWNSPRHRDLILSPTAAEQKPAGIPAVGISSKKIGREILVSLVIGYQKQIPVSETSAPHKKTPRAN